MATLSAVTMGVLATEPATSDDHLMAASGSPSISGASKASASDVSSALARRGDVVSRSTIRTAAKAESAAREDMAVDQQARRLAKKLDQAMWTTDMLNLWDGPSEKAEKFGEIGAIKQVAVTGREQLGRTQVVIDGQSRWVTSEFLADERPEPDAAAEHEEAVTPGLGGACTNGTTAGGAGPNIVKIHAAVCANFPAITTYGTLRGGGGDHPLGKAVDIMVSGSTGWAVAEFVRANAAALGVNYIIFSQKIWSVQRSGEGWRSMEDRGSITANHYDHVHVSSY